MSFSAADLHTLIRKRVRQQGETMSDFVKNTQLSRSYMYNLMAGNVADPGIKTLYKLSKALNMPCTAMFRLFRSPNDTPIALNDIHRALRDSGDQCMFAGDINHPDYAVVLQAEAFTKTWAIQNVGAVPWKNRHLLRVDSEVVFCTREHNGALKEMVSSHLRCTKNMVAIPDALPGETVQVSADFLAPSEHASVASVWRPVDAEGRFIYSKNFYLQAVVTVIND